ARQAGWTALHEPRLCVTHHRPLHVRPVSPALRFMTRHALLTYAAKHWGRASQGVLASLVGCEATVKEWLSRLHGDPWAAGVFAQLRAGAREVIAGEVQVGRRRLTRVGRGEEQRRAPTCPRHAPPQPAGSLEAVSGECVSAPAAG